MQYVACKANHGAPLLVLELSSYPFSKYSTYVKFVSDVDLATSHLHKSRREISKNEALQTLKVKAWVVKGWTRTARRLLDWHWARFE